MDATCVKVSSSSDSKSLREVAGDVTWLIADLELSLEDILDELKDLKESTKLIKNSALSAHQDDDASKKEEMLCYLCLLPTIRDYISSIKSDVCAANAEIQQSTDNL